MLKSLFNIFKIPELRRRIIFTLALLSVCRLGAHIPAPGIDGQALATFWKQMAEGTIFGFIDMFSGGALGQMTIFALGIMPYITASIIFQLLTVVIPRLEQLAKEGEEGRKKITQYTRYGTVIIGIVQSFGISFYLQGQQTPVGPLVPNPGLFFSFLTVITMTAGTIFLMWLGENISERGIGNGISLIIFVNIISRVVPDGQRTLVFLRTGELSLFVLFLLLGIVVFTVSAVIFIESGQRKVPVQYAKRIVGRRMYTIPTTHIPLRVDQSGVIAVIFAMAVMSFPLTLATFSKIDFLKNLSDFLQRSDLLYSAIYGGLIIFFCYFYTAVTFNPVDLADNMRKYGGFIPGVRPGKNTADYIDKILTRIILAGALFVATIAILPRIIYRNMGVPFWAYVFGGTAILIIVGVDLDTMRQVESHLLMRHYDGFLKKGRLRGR
jgi:preprotein translocase subunit SecY